MQPFIQALPLTALIDALRGVINEGRSLAAVGSEIAILAAWGSDVVRAGAEAVPLAVMASRSGSEAQGSGLIRGYRRSD